MMLSMLSVRWLSHNSLNKFIAALEIISYWINGDPNK
jgi:hypothetical protein